jgi:hypothetical protein
MFPYGSYQQYEIERPKSLAEIRRANQQLGEFSRTMSEAWHDATRPAGALLAIVGRRRPRVGARQTAPFHRELPEAQSAATAHFDRTSARC